MGSRIEMYGMVIAVISLAWLCAMGINYLVSLYGGG